MRKCGKMRGKCDYAEMYGICGEMHNFRPSHGIHPNQPYIVSPRERSPDPSRPGGDMGVRGAGSVQGRGVGFPLPGHKGAVRRLPKGLHGGPPIRPRFYCHNGKGVVFQTTGRLLMKSGGGGSGWTPICPPAHPSLSCPEGESPTFEKSLITEYKKIDEKYPSKLF